MSVIFWLTSKTVKKHELHKNSCTQISLQHTWKIFTYRECLLTPAISPGGKIIAYYQLSLISSKFEVMCHRLYSVLWYAEHSSESHCLSVNMVWNNDWPTPTIRSLLGKLILNQVVKKLPMFYVTWNNELRLNRICE